MNLESTIFPKPWRSPSRFSILLRNTSRYVLQSARLKTKRTFLTFPYSNSLQNTWLHMWTVHPAIALTIFLTCKQKPVVPTLYKKLQFMDPTVTCKQQCHTLFASIQLTFCFPSQTEIFLSTENFLFVLKFFISSMCGTSEVSSKHGEWSGEVIDRMKE